MSLEGHRWVEDHKAEAETLGLIVRIREDYDDHIKFLHVSGQDLNEPVFYLKQELYEASLIQLRRRLSIG